MKITKKQLKRIIKEELVKEAGEDPLQILEMVANELIKDGKDMENWPSHEPASNVASWVLEKGQQVKQALNMLDADAGRNPGGTIGEQLASGGVAKKATDLDAARDAGRSRDQIGRVEAIKLIRNLEDMGYTVSRGAVNQLADLLQAMEQSEDIRHGG